VIVRTTSEWMMCRTKTSYNCTSWWEETSTTAIDRAHVSVQYEKVKKADLMSMWLLWYLLKGWRSARRLRTIVPLGGRRRRANLRGRICAHIITLVLTVAWRVTNRLWLLWSRACSISKAYSQLR
jgi:hypothetical protein